MSGSDVDDAVNNLLLTLRGNCSKDVTRMDGSEYHLKELYF